MTQPTHTQATKQKETQDAQVEKTTDALKEAASPENPSVSTEVSSLVSEGDSAAGKQQTQSAPQADAQSDWQAHFMPVTLDCYHQQFHQPRQHAEPQRRLTLPIPERLHRDIKVYCARQDLQLGNLIAALLHTCFYGDEDQGLSPLVNEDTRTNQQSAQEDRQVLKAA